MFPLLCIDGVRGAVWVPTDGYADPSQLTHSFATGARALGVRFVENTAVTGVERAGRRVVGLLTTGRPDRVRHRGQRDRDVGRADSRAGGRRISP